MPVTRLYNADPDDVDERLAPLRLLVGQAEAGVFEFTDVRGKKADTVLLSQLVFVLDHIFTHAKKQKGPPALLSQKQIAALIYDTEGLQSAKIHDELRFFVRTYAWSVCTYAQSFGPVRSEVSLKANLDTNPLF